MAADKLAQTLADYIAERAGAQTAKVTDFRRLSGGAIQDNFALSVVLEGGDHPGPQDYVVRSDAPSGVSASLSRPQEFRILQVAHTAGVTVPEPFWLCEDTGVIGQQFYVMSRAGGTASPQRLVKAELTDQQRRGLTRQLGRELGRLHSIRPPHPDLDFLTVPTTPASASRIDLYRHYLAAIPEPHPVLEWALNWLQDHPPAATEPVLCHCDFRTGNFMAKDGALTAILDWEFATWSDPAEDLGWLCSRSWRFGAPDREVGGIGDKDDLFAGYADISGQRPDPARVSYWEVMALVRWAVIALQQAQRHLTGDQPSLELALTGRMLPQMEFDLLQQIRQLGF
ncbi:phosphotransferase family protein [Marinobacter caseinilyticus]|uniref:phosphotransferase family protein n=1 Tax=Marinobacter caseinilyticus TaxID=2692195 RepID=UPI00140D66A3|nr:phosphotransferase family protein [Marinobacter caseinilyticus]